MKRLLLVSFLFVLVVGCCQAEDFKFALLTDIHISKNPSAAEDLERSVAQINKASDLAFVLVSGDITEEGDCFSLHVAKDILDKLSIPYYIISRRVNASLCPRPRMRKGAPAIRTSRLSTKAKSSRAFRQAK